jgi:hypothetical protein
VNWLASMPKFLPLLVLVCLLLAVPLVFSQASMTITVSTDKPQYLQGETVNISGKVLDSQNNPVAGATVSIQVGDPPMHINLVYSDNSGAFLDSFILPTSAAPGSYTVYASVGKAGYASSQAQTQFIILTQTTAASTSSSSSSTSSSSSSSSQSSGPPSQCFIATATYGSEVAPEVALLRYFRDAQVLRTSAGRSFMQVFNAFYYSFSPQVASFISANGIVRSSMKVILYPLIGILFVSSRIFQILSFNAELSITISGIIAALGIGVVYVGPILVICNRLSRRRVSSLWSTLRQLNLVSCIISTFAIIVGEEIYSPLLLTSATVATVLSFMLLGALSVQVFASRVSVSERNTVES